MVKTVLGVNHQGLRDWLVQRVSAVVMAIYFVGIIAYFVTRSRVDFMDWHILFSHGWMKVATILFVLSLSAHAWVGMWTIFTDYIKPFFLRLMAHILVFFTLLGCIFWAIQILWGV
jgi:succinate dehydrogenase / fumarate reductase membrane anchor subunit